MVKTTDATRVQDDLCLKKDLLKVLIGIAWVDGEISKEENSYLTDMAQQLGLDQDLEIQDLLNFDRVISFQQCLQLITSYLKRDRSDRSHKAMLQQIQSLIQADGVISGPEKSFLQINAFLQGSLDNPELTAQIEQCHSLDETIALAKAWGYELEVTTFKQARGNLQKISGFVTASILTFGVIAGPALPARAGTAPRLSDQDQPVRQEVAQKMVAADLLDAIAGELRGEETPQAVQESLDQQVNQILSNNQAAQDSLNQQVN